MEWEREKLLVAERVVDTLDFVVNTLLIDRLSSILQIPQTSNKI